MTRTLFLLASLLSCAASAAVSNQAPALPKLSAEQIVEKNIAARGGLAAWRGVTSMAMSGTIEAGGTRNTPLPFTMKVKRGHKSRLEIQFQNQTAVQVYDGKQGWKWRPFLGRSEVEPYSDDEAKSAENWDEIDGPLVDYASKGTRLALLGAEAVDGHNSYVLELTAKSGQKRKLWIDGNNFLEVKIEGVPRKMDGKPHKVDIYYREFTIEHGLKIPHVLETVVEDVKHAPAGKASHKMLIEHVSLNANLDDGLFAKPVATLVNASAR